MKKSVKTTALLFENFMIQIGSRKSTSKTHEEIFLRIQARGRKSIILLHVMPNFKYSIYVGGRTIYLLGLLRIVPNFKYNIHVGGGKCTSKNDKEIFINL